MAGVKKKRKAPLPACRAKALAAQEADAAAGIVRLCKGCGWRTVSRDVRMCSTCAAPVSKDVAHNVADLCRIWGSDAAHLGEALYGSTACGAHLSLHLAGGTTLHNGDRGWANVGEDTPAVGITVGTIVEGSDVFRADFPITMADFYRDVEALEAEADFYWRRDNLDHFTVEPRDPKEREGWGAAEVHGTEVNLTGSFTRRERKALVAGIRAWGKSVYDGGGSFRHEEARKIDNFLVTFNLPDLPF